MRRGGRFSSLESREQVLATYLRLVAAVDLIAALAVIMPQAWMQHTHESLGLGEFPVAPLVGYLTRSISMLYAGQGALLWFLASDVRRFAPVIRFFGRLVLVCAAVLVSIDLVEGMPLWWLAGEAICVTGLGLSILGFARFARAASTTGAVSFAEAPSSEELASVDAR